MPVPETQAFDSTVDALAICAGADVLMPKKQASRILKI